MSKRLSLKFPPGPTSTIVETTRYTPPDKTKELSDQDKWVLRAGLNFLPTDDCEEKLVVAANHMVLMADKADRSVRMCAILLRTVIYDMKKYIDPGLWQSLDIKTALEAIEKLADTDGWVKDQDTVPGECPMCRRRLT